MMDRQTLLSVFKAARLAGRSDYASRIASDWLSVWPGDIEVQRLLAEIEIERGPLDGAIGRLTKLIIVDPEFQEAYRDLEQALLAHSDGIRAQVISACYRLLRGEPLDPERSPSWTLALGRAMRALSDGDCKRAVIESREALSADPNLPLPALVAFKAHLGAEDRQAATALARAGYDRWPECLPFRFHIALDYFERAETSRGVEILHRAAADDPTGTVAHRILGEDHPYSALWPAELTMRMEHPTPAEVAVVLGENNLPAGSASSTISETPSKSENARLEPDQPIPGTGAESGGLAQSKIEDRDGEEDLPSPEPWEAFQGPDPGGEGTEAPSGKEETLLDIREGLQRVASRINARQPLADEDGRLPAYIILSSRTRLTQEFGEDRFQRIDNAVKGLLQSVGRRRGWTAYRIYIDDPTTLTPFGLRPCDPANPWQIKLRLADLDQYLATKAEMIGAVFIVGGHRIVPFHMLPNPTDDDDDAIPSDNPYATTDENYFAPEWPVGRIPSDDDPNLIVNLLRIAAESHQITNQSISLFGRIQLWVLNRFGSYILRRPRAFGYSASIWRKSSQTVFRTIGDPRHLITSPPIEAGDMPLQMSSSTGMSYFNLHGLERSPEWFGQRDPILDDTVAIEFPVALRPEDVVNHGRAPVITFTEACYGANVLDKSADAALCLKFLECGSRAVIGSTKISYGSIRPPLIAADLLGKAFWEQLNRPLPVGEALRRAKLNLAAEMHRRQGFLDGEDQKTIVSFILYGDPLFQPNQLDKPINRKSVIRRTTRPRTMNTSCALGECDISIDELEPTTLERVKSIVAQYLPGMAQAEYRLHSQRWECSGGDHECPTHQLGIKAAPRQGQRGIVVTLARHISIGPHNHQHFARVTLDDRGKILKLAVSR